ncbi:hypothetical protein GCM10007916_00110 [Psychromonas marina]|uniref:Uncharacterized protein n=1 Tax=Psychromonas marina TaxID=88364 RepID=A0ABQ6DV65_9GAMM|nr:hypothetical protein GCM10007916_00110 [Psychromonas marina]
MANCPKVKSGIFIVSKDEDLRFGFTKKGTIWAQNRFCAQMNFSDEKNLCKNRFRIDKYSLKFSLDSFES